MMTMTSNTLELHASFQANVVLLQQKWGKRLHNLAAVNLVSAANFRFSVALCWQHWLLANLHRINNLKTFEVQCAKFCWLSHIWKQFLWAIWPAPDLLWASQSQQNLVWAALGVITFINSAHNPSSLPTECYFVRIRSVLYFDVREFWDPALP